MFKLKYPVVIKKNYTAHGKILLTGEYLVLEGANALALPTKVGQKLSVTENSSSDINWTSYDQNHEAWFSAKFSLYDFKAIDTTDTQIAQRITQLLKACARQDSEFLSQWKGQKVETLLEFKREWGLGTSSSLIYCIAEWADVSPYQLLMDTFGGSGYDVACAGADGPILYSINDYAISIEEAVFTPGFSNNLYFVYLGKKQNSQEEVSKFKKANRFKTSDIDAVTTLTQLFLNCKKLPDFQKLMAEHEQLISTVINQPKIKQLSFSDFDGEIKSLGAWGGDFVLAATSREHEYVQAYFQAKGLKDILAYDDLILKRK